jgi:hypothetical protein
MAVLLADREMVSIVEEQRKLYIYGLDLQDVYGLDEQCGDGCTVGGQGDGEHCGGAAETTGPDQV